MVRWLHYQLSANLGITVYRGALPVPGYKVGSYNILLGNTMKRGMLIILLALPASIAFAQIPPLPVNILNPSGQTIGKAEIFPNYIVLRDSTDRRKGAIGVVLVEGRMRLFVVSSDDTRTLVGWAEEQRLFNTKGELLGFYYWTPIWSYVYDKSMTKVGQAQCLAYQGVCAAGIAGYLLGLL